MSRATSEGGKHWRQTGQGPAAISRKAAKLGWVRGRFWSRESMEVTSRRAGVASMEAAEDVERSVWGCKLR